MAKSKAINIGIVDSEFHSNDEDSVNEYFWNTPHGWSWFSGVNALWHRGQHHNADEDKRLRKGYAAGDTVDVYLDLKDDNSLSFGKKRRETWQSI